MKNTDTVITARYPGTCRACGQPFAVGAPLLGSKVLGWRHASCPAGAAARHVPRRLSGRGCLNPSDCGDPTCRGECGYPAREG